MIDLEKIRTDINDIDTQLVELFEKRMKLVYGVAEYKLKTGKEIYDSKREQEVINKAIKKLQDPGMDVYTKEFFEELMDVSKKYQETLIPKKNINIEHIENDGSLIGFQGVSGSYSEQAVHSLYGSKVNANSYETFNDLFKAVLNDEVSIGVLPYENSSTGGISDVLDLLREYNLFINAQVDVKIEHCLLAPKGAKTENIKFVYSHQQGLNQCSKFLEKTEMIPCSYLNTAIAARDVKKWNDLEKASISSRIASKIYDLEILESNIQDNDLNTTRFIAISKKLSVNESCDKTSICFSASHIPGALYRILEHFYENDINILRIESRPNKKRNFEYYFYVDIGGNINKANVIKAIKHIKEYCGYFKILGSYKSLGGK